MRSARHSNQNTLYLVGRSDLFYLQHSLVIVLSQQHVKWNSVTISPVAGLRIAQLIILGFCIALVILYSLCIMYAPARHIHTNTQPCTYTHTPNVVDYRHIQKTVPSKK